MSLTIIVNNIIISLWLSYCKATYNIGYRLQQEVQIKTKHPHPKKKRNEYPIDTFSFFTKSWDQTS